MFDHLKNKITSKEMAPYLILFLDHIMKDDKPIKDVDGNIICSKYERSLMLLAFICDLLDSNNLKNVKSELISFFIQENFKEIEENDLLVETIVLYSRIVEITKYFAPLPTYEEYMHKIGTEFPFNKDLNSVQTFNLYVWYNETARMINIVFKDVFLENLIRE